MAISLVVAMMGANILTSLCEGVSESRCEGEDPPGKQCPALSAQGSQDSHDACWLSRMTQVRWLH